jgi:iron complex transport system ATP-binding protein
MDYAIEIERIACGYRQKFAIQDVSFPVPRGKLTSVIGPNGAGKTTLFRAITGMLPLKNGQILVDGESITQMNHKSMAKRLAIVNQTVEADNISIEDARPDSYKEFSVIFKEQ